MLGVMLLPMAYLLLIISTTIVHNHAPLQLSVTLLLRFPDPHFHLQTILDTLNGSKSESRSVLDSFVLVGLAPLPQVAELRDSQVERTMLSAARGS
jgi:hypothetical protein